MNHYQALEVYPNATQEEIKKSFRRLSVMYHPDKEGGDVKKFHKVKEAYQELSNPEKRRNYDLQLALETTMNVEEAAEKIVTEFFNPYFQEVTV
jgi:curved DNA-binding protein CbpA